MENDRYDEGRNDYERLLFGETEQEFFDAVDRGEITPKGKSL